MTHRKNVGPPPVIPVSESFFAVDAMTRIGEAHGWPGPAAFAIAMRLYIEGVTPAQAERLFNDCARRVQ